MSADIEPPFDRYHEGFKPLYRVRDESYTGPDDSIVPRFFVERRIATGRQAWGITTYKTKAVADQIVAILNAAVLDEVP